MTSEPGTLKIRPRRAPNGRVLRPARIQLVGPDGPHRVDAAVVLVPADGVCEEMVDRDQVESWAKRKGMSLAEAEKWLAPNLGYNRESRSAA